MVAQKIIFTSLSEPDRDVAAIAGPHLAVVSTGLVRKGSGFPSFHPCCGYGNPINTPPFIGRLTSDFFKACTPEKLACA